MRLKNNPQSFIGVQGATNVLRIRLHMMHVTLPTQGCLLLLEVSSLLVKTTPTPCKVFIA